MGDISKNFSRSEFACSDNCGFDEVNPELLELAQDVRDHFGRPMDVHCVCRCLKKNRSVGSKDTSQHVKATAMDCHITGIDNEDIYDYVDKKLINTGGVGLYPWGVHMDVRKRKARWRAHT